MKSKEVERLGTLRLIKNSLKNKVIEKRSVLTPQESEQVLAVNDQAAEGLYLAVHERKPAGSGD